MEWFGNDAERAERPFGGEFGMVWDGLGWFGVVWNGLEVVWGGLEVNLEWFGMVWGGLGWFGLVWKLFGGEF